MQVYLTQKATGTLDPDTNRLMWAFVSLSDTSHVVKILIDQIFMQFLAMSSHEQNFNTRNLIYLGYQHKFTRFYKINCFGPIQISHLKKVGNFVF